MTWILFALLATLFFAIMNVLDKYVIDKITKGLFDYMFYFSMIAFLISIGIYFYFGINFNNIGYYSFFGGLLLTPATYFYVKAMEKSEVTIVVPIFNMIPVFLLILSYFVFGQTIGGYQLISFFIILFGSIILSIEPGFFKKFKINTGFYYMLLSSFLFAIILFIGDIVVKHTNVVTVTFWEGIGIFVSTLFFFFNIKTKNEIIAGIKDFSFKKIFSYVGISGFDKLGFIATYKGFALAPLPALVYVIEGIQPFVLLVFTIILTIFFPKIIKENIEKKVVFQKIAGMIVIFVGIYVLYLV